MTVDGRLPTWTAPIIFGALLTCLMSLVVAGVATWKALGFSPDFFARWLAAWLPSWAVAFPTVLVVAPLVRRIVARVTIPPAASR
ncbi:MAG TPA: DUF2798 domain-containing protein [Hyphomicrobiaceae bacterium]|nr:DUF2798 domain-containing protein [Hyphomicrobiaceae bacterium]